MSSTVSPQPYQFIDFIHYANVYFYIQKIQPLEVTIKGTVEALSLTESMWEVCVREEDKEGYKDLVVENDMLRSAIGRA